MKDGGVASIGPRPRGRGNAIGGEQADPFAQMLQLGLDLAVEETRRTGCSPSWSRTCFNWASTSRSRKPGDPPTGEEWAFPLQLGLDLAVEETGKTGQPHGRF